MGCVSALSQRAVSLLTSTQIRSNVWGIIFDVFTVLSNFYHCPILKRCFLPHLLLFFLFRSLVPLSAPIFKGTHLWMSSLGVGDGQGSLACYSPWGCKELDKTEWLNWLTDWLTEYSIVFMYHIFIHSLVDGHLGCLHAKAIFFFFLRHFFILLLFF